MATRKFLAKKQEAIIARLIAAVKRKQLTLRKKHRVPVLTFTPPRRGGCQLFEE